MPRRRLLVLLGLLPAVPARAHLPHDEVQALAAPAALDLAVPWFAVVIHHQTPILLRSNDRGNNWEIVGGAPTAESLVAGAMTADGVAVLLGASRLWWSDDGETWHDEASPVSAASELLWADGLFLSGPEGVWRADGPAGPWTLELDAPVRAIGGGRYGVAAITRAGAVLLRGEAGWDTVAGPPPGPSAVAVGPDATYVGAGDGGVWRAAAGTWSACGEVPTRADGWPEIVALVDDGAALWVASGHGGPWLSGDGCATWLNRSGLDAPDTHGTGAPSDPTDVVRVLLAAGDRVFVGGWAGLRASSDAGLSWATAPLLGPAFTRGVAFSPDYLRDRRIWLGPYASGVLLSRDGGASVEPPAPGAPGLNVSTVVVRPDDPDEVWAIGNHGASVSQDGGASWTSPDLGYGFVAAIVALADRVMVVGEPSDGGVERVSWTDDAGASIWHEDGLADALGDSTAVGAVVHRGRLCVLGQAPTVLACGGHGAWQAVYQSDGETTAAVLAWPDADGRLVVADAFGVSTSDDGLAWSTADPAPGDPAALLTPLPDGAIVLATRAGRLLRSDDGGASFTDLGLQLNAEPLAAAAHPAPTWADGLLVANADGVWWVGTPSPGRAFAQRWSGIDRIEDQARSSTDFLTCAGCSYVDDTEAGLGTQLLLPPDARLEVMVRGRTLRILGASDSKSTGTVEVDGVAVGVVGGAPHALGDGPLWEIEGLLPSWHTLVVTGATGGALAIDAVEGVLGARVFHEPADSGLSGDSGGADGGADPADSGGAPDSGASDGGASDGGASDGGAPAGVPPLGSSPSPPPGCGCRGMAGEGSGILGLLGLLALCLGRPRRVV